MDHVAIDLGGRESQICVRTDDGRVLEEARLATKGITRWLEQRSPCRLVMETCAESFAIADQALLQGHQVRIVPSTLVRSLGVGARRTKNDRRDALALSEASCRMELPSVHIPSTASRRRKTLCSARDALVSGRTKMINCVRGWLRQSARAPRRGSAESFARRVRELLGETIPQPIALLLESIDQLTAQIRQTDQLLSDEVKHDPVCVRLMTVPGVGPVTATRFSAALDVVERFPDAHTVESYFGLVPGERSSGDRVHRLGITKAGPGAVRTALVQAAWTARRYSPQDPMVRWCFEVERRRGKLVAVFALARKLAGILYAVWRDQSTYDPLRGAK